MRPARIRVAATPRGVLALVVSCSSATLRQQQWQQQQSSISNGTESTHPRLAGRNSLLCSVLAPDEFSANESASASQTCLSAAIFSLTAVHGIIDRALCRRLACPIAWPSGLRLRMPQLRTRREATLAARF